MDDPDENMLLFSLMILFFTVSLLIYLFEHAFVHLNRMEVLKELKTGNQKVIMLRDLLGEAKHFQLFLSMSYLVLNVSFFGSLFLFLLNLKFKLTLSLTFLLGIILIQQIIIFFLKKLNRNHSYPICFYLVKPFHSLYSFLKKEQSHSREPIVQLPNVEDFHSVFELAEQQDIITHSEGEMLKGVLTFRKSMIKEILKTPRIKMVGIPLQASYEEIKEIILSSEFSRFPVYDNDLDNVIGLLFAKDFFAFNQKESGFQLNRIIKKREEIIFVSENTKVSSLFSQMKRKQIHMAIVLDEYGGTEGLITLEDLLEVIVGEINDESDEESSSVLYLADTKAIVYSDISLQELNQQFSLQLPFTQNETLYSFLVTKFGGLVRTGDSFTFNNTSFTVLSTEEQSPYRIKIDHK